MDKNRMRRQKSILLYENYYRIKLDNYQLENELLKTVKIAGRFAYDRGGLKRIPKQCQ